MPEEHDLSGSDCWCEPSIENACPNCVDQVSAMCAICAGNGWLPKFNDDGPFVVVHRVNRPKHY